MSDNTTAQVRKADEYEPLGHDWWEVADRIAALVIENREMALYRLRALEAEIVSGSFPGDLTPAEMGFLGHSISTVYAAFSGSLDAAKALHDAVLPGWDVLLLDQASNLAGSPWGCMVAWFDGSNPSKNRKAYSGHNFDKNPARAWLLAIVRALIWQEENHNDR